MDTSKHNQTSLFKQLGLPEDEEERQAIFRGHLPLSANILLHDAPFWSIEEATFLREAISDDSDWAYAVDRLNAMLRS